MPGGGPAVADASGSGSGLAVLGRGVACVIEAAFVFLPYYWRPLFPKTALRDSHKHREKNTDPANLDFCAFFRALGLFSVHFPPEMVFSEQTPRTPVRSQAILQLLVSTLIGMF